MATATTTTQPHITDELIALERATIGALALAPDLRTLVPDLKTPLGSGA